MFNMWSDKSHCIQTDFEVYFLLTKYLLLMFKGTAMIEWLSPWLAEQGVWCSIPHLATWISRDLVSLASKSQNDWKIVESDINPQNNPKFNFQNVAYMRWNSMPALFVFHVKINFILYVNLSGRWRSSWEWSQRTVCGWRTPFWKTSASAFLRSGYWQVLMYNIF